MKQSSLKRRNKSVLQTQETQLNDSASGSEINDIIIETKFNQMQDIPPQTLLNQPSTMTLGRGSTLPDIANANGDQVFFTQVKELSEVSNTFLDTFPTNLREEKPNELINPETMSQLIGKGFKFLDLEKGMKLWKEEQKRL